MVVEQMRDGRSVAGLARELEMHESDAVSLEASGPCRPGPDQWRGDRGVEQFEPRLGARLMP